MHLISLQFCWFSKIKSHIAKTTVCFNTLLPIRTVPEETVSLTTVFKNSIEYKEIERVLEPLLDEAAEVSRGKTPQYNRNFLWQVSF